ncbi:MAG: hypothetical protein ACOH17_04945 [Cellulomonas sp.]
MPAPSATRASLALLALALGGFTIGTTEFATMGLLAPAWVGAVLTAAGLLVVATVGRSGPHEHAAVPPGSGLRAKGLLEDDETEAGLAVVR